VEQRTLPARAAGDGIDAVEREEIEHVEAGEHFRVGSDIRTERQVHRALPGRVRLAACGLQQMALADTARTEQPQRLAGAARGKRTYVRDRGGIAPRHESPEL